MNWSNRGLYASSCSNPCSQGPMSKVTRPHTALQLIAKHNVKANDDQFSTRVWIGKKEAVAIMKDLAKLPVKMQERVLKDFYNRQVYGDNLQLEAGADPVFQKAADKLG